VPTGPQWAYEIKHDGYRFICRRDGDRARVFSRRGNDHTDRAPGIAEALMSLKVRSVTIDGEGVVCGPDGVTDFNRLRAALGRKGSTPARNSSRAYVACTDSVSSLESCLGWEGPDRPRGGGHVFLGWGPRSGPNSPLFRL
jgi:ATP-dependent DNA ligase